MVTLVTICESNVIGFVDGGILQRVIKGTAMQMMKNDPKVLSKIFK